MMRKHKSIALLLVVLLVASFITVFEYVPFLYASSLGNQYVTQIPSSNIDGSTTYGTHSNFTAEQEPVNPLFNDTLTEGDTVSATFGNTAQSGSTYTTFGTTYIGNTASTGSSYSTLTTSGYIGGDNLTATPTGTYQLLSVTASLAGSAFGTVNATAIITSSSGSVVTNGISVNRTLSVTTAVTNYTFTFSTNPTLSANTVYIVGIRGNTSASPYLRLYYSSTTTGYEYHNTSIAGSPTTITWTHSNDTNYNIWDNISIISAEGGEWGSSSSVSLTSIEFYAATATGTTSAEGIITTTSGSVLTNGIGSTVTVTTTAGWSTSTFSTPPSVSASTTYCLLVCSEGNPIELYYSATSSGTEEHNYTVSSFSPSSIPLTSSNSTLYSLYANIQPVYALNLEEQWTNTNTTAPNANCSIYLDSFSSDNKALGVQCYTASGWTVLSTSLSANQWNNFTITSYMNSTFTIDFYNSSDTGLTTQSWWNVSSDLIYTWTPTYSLSLEIKNYENNTAISGASVDMNNGTDNVVTSSANGWANYTGVSGSVIINVTYYGYLVNSTASFSVNSNMILYVICNIYNITVSEIETVSSHSGKLCGANVTVYSSSGTLITSGVTANSTGQVSLSALPGATLTFSQYAGSSYNLLIGNTTSSVSSDSMTITLTATQNNVTVTDSLTTYGWKPTG
jgi:hypothetical protein